MDDDDFNEEIQDIGSIQTDTLGAEGEVLFVQIGKEIEWFDFRRQEKGLLQHHECCFGINHWRYAKSHQLYMVDVVPEEDQHKELVPQEVVDTKEGEILQDNDVKHALKIKRPQYYDKQ
jgi:hypothetical protein